MSMELYIAVSAQSLPTREQIESAIQTGAIRMTVPELNWTDQSGFLPMVLAGRESGIEVDVFAPADARELLAGFGLPRGEVTHVIGLRWGGDFAEAACAYAFATAVSRAAGGRILDPQEGTEITADEAMSEAEECLKELN